MFSKKKAAAGVAAAALALSILMTGCGANPKAALIKIDTGDIIEYGYANFVAKYYQAQYDINYKSYYGSEMWNTDVQQNGTNLEQNVKDQVISQIEEQWVIRQHASDYSVTLSDDDNAKIEEYSQKFLDANTENGLSKLGGSKEYAVEFLTNMAYAIKVQNEIYKEANTNFTAAETEQSTISYVKFSTEGTTGSDGTETPMSDEDKAAAKKNAEDLVAAGAANFETKASELSAEVKSFSYTKADSTFEGMILPENVINESKKLKEGEISKVIEGSDGYYVVRMDKLLDEEATENKKSVLISSAKSTRYNEVVEGWKGSYTFTLDEKLWEKESLQDVSFTQKAAK
ncbi:MAG: peptidyl-prolyl cis-trans isomerase [Lachnospiraceae bacterium]|nr:peptidyl-prolyl cis-trans isomerase [Lachnospiraceae bacterium]